MSFTLFCIINKHIIYIPQLTSQIKEASQSVIQIKKKLESGKENDDSQKEKWNKLSIQFLAQYERLKNCADRVRQKFQANPIQKQTIKSDAKSPLLDDKK